MGNQTSNLKLDHEKVLKKTINDIAAKYILTQNFQDLIGLREPENCNDLVILTSDVINHSLNWRSIIFLDQYLKKGKPINKLTKESLLYLDKNDLNNLDVENGTEKKRMCIGISKFYIKLNFPLTLYGDDAILDYGFFKLLFVENKGMQEQGP